jgi:hypothetical protein
MAKLKPRFPSNLRFWVCWVGTNGDTLGGFLADSGNYMRTRASEEVGKLFMHRLPLVRSPPVVLRILDGMAYAYF